MNILLNLSPIHEKILSSHLKQFKEKVDYMLVFHASTFILYLHTAGGHGVSINKRGI